VFASRTTRCTPLLSTTFHRITFLATANHFLPLGAPIVVSFFRLSSGMFENEKKTFGVRAWRKKILGARMGKTTMPCGSLEIADDTLRLGPLCA
jgi:hypothetical protein